MPIDVQALYVPPNGSEPMVRLPMLVANVGSAPVTDPEAGLPDPFDAGLPRPGGVHLHWAMPDALLRGTFADRADAGANRLALPVLPDRFVVLRIVLPKGAVEPVLTGWVIEADRAVAVPLAQWAEGNAAAASAEAAGAPIPRADLTGTVGGSLAWAGVVRRGAQPLRLPRSAGRPGRPWRRKAWTATTPLTSSPAGGARPRSTRSTRRATTRACTSCSSVCAGA